MYFMTQIIIGNLTKKGEIPTEYCAIEQIEVQEDNRKFSIGLVDIRKQIQDKRK